MYIADTQRVFEGPGEEALPAPPPRAAGKLWHIDGGSIVAGLHPGQAEAYTSEKSIVAIVAGTQSGKPISASTAIPTTRGWRTMGDIEVGEHVFDANGQPTRVVATTPLYFGRECFRLTFDDGTFVIADADHEWVTQTYTERKNQARARPENTVWTQSRPQCQSVPRSSIRTTKEIALTLLDFRGAANHSLSLSDGPDLPDVNLPIPPYVLGAWLGDGDSNCAGITGVDVEILEHIRAEGVSVGVGRPTGAGAAFRFSLGRGLGVPGISRANALQGRLRALGVLGNKHIPEAYLFGSRAQRLALVQGLMDTDGSVAPKGQGARCEFVTVLPRLASDVATLLRSIGIKVRIATKVPTIAGVPKRLAYRLQFTTMKPVFLLPRKQARLRRFQRPDTCRRFIVGCDPVPSEPVRCITVENSAHEFLCTTAFIPTHNCLALDTPIPTASGWSTMGELQVGGSVLDEEGHPTRIDYASPVYKDHACYQLTFSDGAKVVADSEHLWRVQSEKQRRANAAFPQWSVLPTHRIATGIDFKFSVRRPTDRERYIVAAERVPSIETRCISVAGKSKLYLCSRNYIPTHNTSFGPLWMEKEIGLRGPGDYLAVSTTVRLSRLKMVPEFLKLFDQALRLGTWHKGDRFFELNPDKAALYFSNDAFRSEPTRIIFGSAVNPDSLESATAKAAWLDEAGQKWFRLESWEAVRRRLTLNRGRVLITTTPYNLGWLYVNVYQPWLAGDPAIDVISFSSDQNPAFPKEALEEERRRMPEWRFKLFYLGKFEKPEGLIYAAYSDLDEPDGMVVDPFEIPMHWPVFVGVDFGGANTALVWLAMNPDNQRFYVFHESLSGGKTSQQHAEEFRRVAGNRPVVGVYGGSASEEQHRRDWRTAGIPIKGPPVVRSREGRESVLTDVEVGIERTLALMTSNRFRILRTCVGVRAELGDYSRVLQPDGTPTDQIDDKAKFHRLDALRYVCQHLFRFAMSAPGVLAQASAVGWQPR